MTAPITLNPDDLFKISVFVTPSGKLRLLVDDGENIQAVFLNKIQADNLAQIIDHSLDKIK